MRPDTSNDHTYINEHLSNDRTLLAWLSASMAIMAFGFVVIKFSLFASHFAPFLDLPPSGANGGSALLGVASVVLGLVSIAMAWFRFLSVRRQLRQGRFVHSAAGLALVAGLVFLIGLVLAVFLAIASCKATPVSVSKTPQTLLQP